MANRQIARDLKVSPETINRHIARLGRHCLLFHFQMMKNSPPVREVVVDGFETFEFSQYFPIHHHLAVEKGSDFVIYFTDSELRRKGRMTAYQKRRRRELELKFGRPDPKAVEKDMRQLLEVTLQGQPFATVFSDDHPAYKRSIKYPDNDNRSSDNPRFGSSGQEQLFVGGELVGSVDPTWQCEPQAGNAGLVEASAIECGTVGDSFVWRNYMKGRREKVRGSPTPAMERGMMDRPLAINDLLARRIFRTRCELPPRWAEYYDRQVVTRALKRNLEHELKMAY